LGSSELAALDVIGYDRSGGSQMPADINTLLEDDGVTTLIGLTGAAVSSITTEQRPHLVTPDVQDSSSAPR
jgi:hypothetical protein